MEKLFSDDYDPYDSGWENELDQLIQEAYDSDYANDGNKDGNDGYRHLKKTLLLIFCSIASVLHLVCFVLILLLCKGVIRIIYATRVAILELASLSQIATSTAYATLNHFNSIYYTESFTMEDKHDITFNGNTMPTLWTMFCSVIIHSLFLIEESLPLILFHEL